MKFSTSFLVVLIYSVAYLNQITIEAKVHSFVRQANQPHWLSNLYGFHRLEKASQQLKQPEDITLRSALLALRSPDDFKGCIDPSEPFQCPKSQHCIPLHFICDGHPGDCPDNFDENEETCIAAKRPAKENLESFFQAEYASHGSKFFSFLFGKKISKSIHENSSWWLNSLASAFSVSKTIEQFGEKLGMTSEDLSHFKNVLETIHEGKLEDIPMFAQEAVNQGLAALIEKLYESGFIGSANE